MSTETRVPIKVGGWVVVIDHKVARVEIDRNEWEFSALPFPSPYGEDKAVVVFHDTDSEKGDRFEADINVTEPIHRIIENTDIAEQTVWDLG